MSEVEEWRDAPGFSGYYEVSNLGRVRSVERLVNHYASTSGKRVVRSQIMRLRQNQCGYPMVPLCVGRKRFLVAAHRLVAKAFVNGERHGLQVNHLDGRKDNCRADNLEWCSPRENSLHSTSVLGNGRGSRHPRSRLTETAVSEIRAMARSGSSARDIAKAFGVSANCVRHIVNGRCWRHVA